MGAGTTAIGLVAPRWGAVPPGEGARLARRVTRAVSSAQTVASVIGALDVFVLGMWVLPAPAHGASAATVMTANAVLLAVLLPSLSALGWWLGARASRPMQAWLCGERAPDERERTHALRTPARSAAISAGLWLAGAVLFGALNAGFSAAFGLHIATVILMGGVTSVATAYLGTERLLRPVTALALAAGGPPRALAPGVTGRLLLAWASATAVPVAGLILVASDALLYDTATERQVAVATIVLAAMALVTGFVATLLVARSVSDPLTALRRAVRRLEAGDLRAEVAVDDASEVGLLQTGFNRMAAGLREREQLRELFGRHVGEDVARAALERGGALGGEVREVAVLFVDVVGSTELAARRPPQEVVALLNRFFAVVVEVCGRHGGWVNKFEGDAALVVFGCPAEHPDCAGAALAAARELRDRLALTVPGVRVGIGVSAGPCVAGNVGAEQRFEYTVIGDPVNEAARLSDLAKRRPERVLASAAVLERTRQRGGWRLGDRVELRGRAEPTRLAVPA